LRAVDLTREIRAELGNEARRIEQHWRKSRTEGASCTLSQAQFFIARAHGFASWPKFAKHVEELGRANSPASRFEAAVEAIVGGDSRALARLLRENPGLVRERSTREHRSALLHYVSANGVEDFRQKTPKNIVEIARMLLDVGADVNAESEAYGGGSTALGLVATSVHPEKAGVQIPLLELLLERGAYIDKPGRTRGEQNAVGACLANGRGHAAQFFAARGARMNFEEAAGLGDLDLVKEYFDENGLRKPAVGPRQLACGFLYACQYGRTDVVRFLLEKGVGPGVRNREGQTGLHWAAYGPHVEIVKLLLEHGAQADAREERFEGTPLDWALYTWMQTKGAHERNRSYATIALLVQAGARFDPGQRSDRAGQSAMLAEIRSDQRMRRALEGGRG
jgi:Ankyrin repeats (3 copies)